MTLSKKLAKAAPRKNLSKLLNIAISSICVDLSAFSYNPSEIVVGLTLAKYKRGFADRGRLDSNFSVNFQFDSRFGRAKC